MQVRVLSVQAQPGPLIAVGVMLAGKVSVTVTVPEVAAPPLLVTVIVYEAPVCPWMKLPGWLLDMVRSGTGAAVITVTSLAVSLDVLVSPPPETVAVFVTEAGALLATFTVNVIAG